MHNFKKLNVWIKSMALVKEIDNEMFNSLDKQLQEVHSMIKSFKSQLKIQKSII